MKDHEESGTYEERSNCLEKLSLFIPFQRDFQGLFIPFPGLATLYTPTGRARPDGTNLRPPPDALLTQARAHSCLPIAGEMRTLVQPLSCCAASGSRRGFVSAPPWRHRKRPGNLRGRQLTELWADSSRANMRHSPILGLYTNWHRSG